jgi:pimeloyl-ACP methyl ester carboxylesterase
MSNADHCVDLLADLIRTEAKEGGAHVVGLSIGAHISVLLAQQYPELITTLTISGYCGFSRIGKQLLPAGIRLIARIATRGTTNSPLSFSESRGIADILRSFPKEPLPIRTLIVVGMRPTAFSKTSDKPKVAKALQKSLSSNKWEAVVKGGDSMGHRWNVDHPDVFAELILRWIDNSWSESKILEKEFKDI